MKNRHELPLKNIYGARRGGGVGGIFHSAFLGLFHLRS